MRLYLLNCTYIAAIRLEDFRACEVELDWGTGAGEHGVRFQPTGCDVYNSQ